MNTETKKFKMTFSNSFGECIIALLVGYYPVRIILLITFATLFNDNDQLAINLANIAWLIFTMWFAWWLSYRKWKKKNIN